MTTEQKAKAYDEAMKAAIVAHKDEDKHLKAILEKIFPELKESEDESIRQKFIKLVKMSSEVGGFALHKWEADEMLAWLEKQGEQKPTEAKLEFNVGDWITFYGGEPFKILKIEAEVNGILNYLLLNQNGHDSFYNKKYVDENARLWTFKDAKNGEVLALSYASQNYLIIYRGLYEKSFKTIISVFCFYSVEEDTFYDETDSFHVMNTGEVIKPASKEQYDTLLKAIAEAGYTFDFEKKELKKLKG